jgi:hypothetical protein
MYEQYIGKKFKHKNFGAVYKIEKIEGNRLIGHSLSGKYFCDNLKGFLRDIENPNRDWYIFVITKFDKHKERLLGLR